MTGTSGKCWGDGGKTRRAAKALSEEKEKRLDHQKDLGKANPLLLLSEGGGPEAPLGKNGPS